MQLSVRDGGGQDSVANLAESDESLPACFERVTAAHRVRIAVASDGWNFSYQELNATANRLAHAILASGGAPGDRVAVLMEHDAPAIAAVIGVLKAARIVVALNPTHPPARLRELMEDCKPTLLVTDEPSRLLATEIAGTGCAILGFDEHSTQGPDHNPPLETSPEQVACLYYTSGSTGRPKGVMATHRQIRWQAFINIEAMELCSADRIPLFGSLSSAHGGNMIWRALLNGMALYPFPMQIRGVTGLAAWMCDRGITAFGSMPPIFRNLMESVDPDFRFSGIRAVYLGGEPLTSDDFKLFRAHFSEHCRLIYGLACSEAALIAWSRLLPGDTVGEGHLPIGSPSRGQEVLILDADDRPVVPGEVGEIVLESRYVAAGYWRNPELTAERFSGDLDDTGTRRVRTGDLGRINAAGMLEHCGRRDDRVKVRGHRIELPEIADALRRLKGIERAAVEAVPRTGREPVLVGFVTVRDDQSWTSYDLRRALRAVLPASMVPSEFVILQNLPITPSGKIDRGKLRQEYHPRRLRQSGGQPTTNTEKLLAGIWAEVFELPDIGPQDDFFALGGDSLMATVIAARVHDAVKVELNLAAFADFPTVAKLALVIDDRLRAGGDDTPPLTPAPRTAPLPMSFVQERIWRFSETTAASAAYGSGRIVRVVGPLDVRVLRDCMDDLIRRHEILRTTFVRQRKRLVSIIHSSGDTSLHYVDLSGVADSQARAASIFRQEAAFVFDVSRTPLFRFTLVRLSDGEYRLLRVSHHIICDAPTWHVYFRELAALYDAKLRREAPPFPEIAPLQYADYAVWQRKLVDPERPGYRQAVSWWKTELSGALPALNLPFARTKAKKDVAPSDGIFLWGIDPQISHRLNALASAQDATRFMVRLAAFSALLGAECGEADVVVGLYVTRRNRLPLRNMLGDFSNLVTLRFRNQPTRSFAQWLSAVRRQVLKAEAQSAIPYDILRGELQSAGIAVPEIKVIFQVDPVEAPVEFAGIKLLWTKHDYEAMPGGFGEAMPWGFTMRLSEADEEHYCRTTFDAGLYDPVGVRVLIDRYKRLLEAISLHPDWLVSDLLATADH